MRAEYLKCIVFSSHSQFTLCGSSMRPVKSHAEQLSGNTVKQQTNVMVHLSQSKTNNNYSKICNQVHSMKVSVINKIHFFTSHYLLRTNYNLQGIKTRSSPNTNKKNFLTDCFNKHNTS